jgi:hypothetical protein
MTRRCLAMEKPLTVGSVFTVLAGILAFGIGGCGPQSNSSGSSGPKDVPAVCTSQGITDGTSFVAKKVQYLYGNPDPTLQYPNYHAPTGYGPVTSPYSDNISDAFSNAPQGFKAELCNLTMVLINLNDCSSSPSACLNQAWAYRETPSQYPKGTDPNSLGTYVAIGKGLWFGSWSQTYHDYETALLQTLLNWGTPTFTGATPDDLDTVVLAALAHEVGHVRWYEKFVTARGGRHANLKNFCSGNFFVGWQGGWGNVTPPGPWRYLETLPARKQDGYQNHQNSPQTNDIDNAIARNSFSTAGQYLAQVYAGNEWPSFFGSITADEDFVETYKLWVLTRATNPLTSLKLSIPTSPSYQGNIPESISGDLQAKLKCFDQDP